MIALGLFLGAAAAAAPAAAPALNSAAQRDVQCFVLYAAAAGSEEQDEKTRQAGAMGLMYYYGKLQVEIPNLDLEAVIRREAEIMQGNARLEAVGEGCDSEFQKQAGALRDLGGKLQDKPKS